MNAEERAAYDKWKKWHDDNKAYFEHEARMREEQKRKRDEEAEASNRIVKEYRDMIIAKDREEKENEGTLDWFIKKVRQERRPIEQVRLQCTAEDAAKYLQAAYETEVIRRGTDLQTDINTTAAIAAVSRWLTTHTKPGLLLRGYIGVGKTTMMWAIRSVIRHLLKQDMHIVDARRIADLGKEASSEFEQMKRYRLLGIDDLGTEPIIVKNYGNEISPLVELLSERYNNRAFTIITTNLTTKQYENGIETDELQQFYGDRTFDRMREMFNFMAYDCTQKSYRK